MKLTKISLAALVALGAFSSVASATPLEEAIKNVDFSGMARYRYTNTRESSKNTPSTSKANHGFKIVTNFKAAIDDNFFGVLGLRYHELDGSGNTDGDKTNTEGTLNVHQLYLGYKIGGTTITAGKQEVGSFFTDDHIGTGIKVVNTDVDGLTLTAFAFDANERESRGYETDGYLLQSVANNGAGLAKVGNLYGIGAVGSYDPVSFQLWYNSLLDVVDLAAVSVEGNFNVTDDFALGAKAQYVNANADKEAQKVITNYEDGNFYAGELSASLFGADVAAGYIGWKADDKKAMSIVIEDKGAGLINPGEEWWDPTLVKGKANFWYGTVGYTFDKFFAGVDYVQGSYKDVNNDKTKIKEIVPRLAYEYNKKLTFSSWYSHYEEKTAGNKEKQDKYRFEAKYAF